MGPTLVVGAVALGVAMSRLALPSVAWAVPVVFVGIGIMLTARGQAGVNSAPWVVASAFGLLYAVAVARVVPVIEQQKVVADVVRWVAQQAGPDVRVCGYQLNRWNNSLVFYANGPVTITDVPEEFRAFMTAESPFYCVMPGSAYDALLTDGVELPVVYRRDGLWATSARSLRRGGGLTPFVVVRNRP